MRGFTDEEIELLGLIALYHRGARPKRKDEKLARLSRGDQSRVLALSAILRLAVALDRGHSQLVRRLRIDRHKRELRIVIDGPGDLALELWAGRAKLEPLAKVLGRRVTLERTALGPAAALAQHADSVPPDDTNDAPPAVGSAIVHRA